MNVYKLIAKSDFDDTYKVKKRKIPCYSKDMMDRLYESEKDYVLVGETKKNNKKKQIGDFAYDGFNFKVSEVGENSKIIYKKANFVPIAEDQYIVLLKNRWIIIIWFLGLLLGIGLAIWLISRIIGSNIGIVEIPDNPLPSLDPNVAVVVDDDTVKEQSEDGGGSVTMWYSLDASLSLSSGNIEMYFINPNASNHSVVIELCVVSGSDEIVIATSGLIPAGMGITTMDFDKQSVVLSAGDYEGKYNIYAYDPVTGEKAIMEMEITDLTISVS